MKNKTQENISFHLSEAPPPQYGLVIPNKNKRKDYSQNNDYHVNREKKKKKLIIPCPGDDWKVSKRARKVETNESSSNEETNNDIANSLVDSISKGEIPDFLKPQNQNSEEIFNDEEENDDRKIPIKDFGRALLRGMGWEEGKAYGRSDKVVQPIELKPRPKLAGLGALSNNPTTEKPKTIDPEKSLEAKLLKNPPKTICEDAIIGIVTGIREGEIGRVLKILGKNRLLIRLSNGLDVKVNISDCKLLNIATFPSDHPVRKFAQSEIGDLNVQIVIENKERKKTKITWVVPYLQVRIISKSFADGKYYKKKGIVIDIIDKYIGEIKMIENGDILRIDQDYLETVIPNIGGSVLVVNGAYRGEECTVESIDKYSAQLKITTTNQIIKNIMFDDFCKLAK